VYTYTYIYIYVYIHTYIHIYVYIMADTLNSNRLIYYNETNKSLTVVLHGAHELELLRHARGFELCEFVLLYY